MRITNRMITDGFMQNLRTNLRNLDRVQQRMSSGQQVRKPSDDPVKLQQILKLQTALDQRNQYIRNIDDADSWLTASDSALNQAGSVLLRIKELGTQALNGTNNQDDLNAMAVEVGQLTEHIGEVANTAHAGRYIFAGTDTGKQPYAIEAPETGAATVQFTGSTTALEYEVGQDVRIKVNTTGQDAFGGTELFEAMEQLRQGMLAGSQGDMQAAMDRVEKSTDTLLTARADIGARMNRLAATRTRYEDDIVNLSALYAKAADADIAEVVMDLKVQENVYQTSLAAAAKIMQPSLLDYLR
jgi:flagellar hook-associated protein 3 FlgL